MQNDSYALKLALITYPQEKVTLIYPTDLLSFANKGKKKIWKNKTSFQLKILVAITQKKIGS